MLYLKVLILGMAVIPAKISLKTEGTKCIGHFCCSKNLLLQGEFTAILKPFIRKLLVQLIVWQ